MHSDPDNAPTTGISGSISKLLSRVPLYSLIFLHLLLAFIIIRNAWMSDDAYISFRTVDNFIHGYGLTWNVVERVQAFTHPLWLFLVTGFNAITGEFYFTVLALNVLLAMGAAIITTRWISADRVAAVFALVLMLLSKAFIDFATSGLENSLSYILLVSIVAIAFSSTISRRNLFWLSLFTGLAALNRFDLVVLVAPLLLAYFLRTPAGGRVSAVILGLTPLALWELFSVVYYGFPLPNTYYAKVKTGLALTDVVHQGMLYFFDTIGLDPLTLIVIFSAIVAGVFWRRRFSIAIAIGLILYLGYVVRVGGDFMTGRFFAAPFLVAVALLCSYRFPDRLGGRLIPFAAILLVGLLSPRSPMVSDATYGANGEAGVNVRGIADERAFYFQNTGLITRTRDHFGIGHPWLDRGTDLRLQGPKVSSQRTIGFTGFAAGPEVYIVDGCALSDPFLARLPATQVYDWRPGHFLRPAPHGYFKTLVSGDNYISDSGLALYYDRLSIVIRGPIFSVDRFRTIWELNIGHYDHLLESYFGKQPVTVSYEQADRPKAEDTRWDAAGNFVIRPIGLIVTLDSVVHNKQVEISVDHNDHYYIAFLNDSLRIGWTTILPERRNGLRVDTVEVPATAWLGGYNAIRVQPYDGDDLYSVGHVRLLD